MVLSLRQSFRPQLHIAGYTAGSQQDSLYGKCWVIYGSSFPSVWPSIHNVLVASATDAMCPWRCHGKIKLLDFSIKALRILSVIDIRSSSVSHPYFIHECPYCPCTHPGCPCGIPYILDASAAKVSIKTLSDLTGSAMDRLGQGLWIKNSHKTNPWCNLFIRKPVRNRSVEDPWQFRKSFTWPPSSLVHPCQLPYMELWAISMAHIRLCVTGPLPIIIRHFLVLWPQIWFLLLIHGPSICEINFNSSLPCVSYRSLKYILVMM